MCGIVGAISHKRNVTDVIFDGLKKLEYRGYDSWGVAIKENNSIAIEKHIGKIGNAKITLATSHIGIGHTRWATHGGVTQENAHPHLDCTKKIVVVHNGIVENYEDLKAQLIAKNHVFLSQTDTEVIAHAIEEERKSKDLKSAVLDTFSMLSGSNAIVVLDIETEEIAACRNGSPLVVGLGIDEFFLGSDVTPFLSFTTSVVYLDDGEAVSINATGVHFFDTATKQEKQKHAENIDWKAQDIEKDGFPHFLLKEIMEQKTTIQKSIIQNKQQLQLLASTLSQAKQIAIIGCGTAYYCSLLGQYFFSQNNVFAQAIQANEFSPFAPFYTKGSVIICVSQSGETADTLLAAKRGKQNGTTIVSLVNARGSSLERLSDICIPVAAGPEIAVISTKAFTAQAAILYALSFLQNSSYENIEKQISAYSDQLSAWLTDKTLETIISIAKKLIDHDHIYLIGKYLNFPAALEVGLKIKETSYIHAESFAAGELKHGVIALIEHDTPCIVLASNDDYKQDVLSSASEIKSRGGCIIGIAPFNTNEFSMSIQTPDSGHLTVLTNCIVGQLLGYYLGVGRGADPDKPRNLAKSVTVK